VRIAFADAHARLTKSVCPRTQALEARLRVEVDRSSAIRDLSSFQAILVLKPDHSGPRTLAPLASFPIATPQSCRIHRRTHSYGAIMQTTTVEQSVPLTLFASESYFELVEPKRVVVSPLELCLLSNPDDLFEDD
jgi:hypothetical protein